MIPFCFGLIFAIAFIGFVSLLSLFGANLVISGFIFSFIVGIIVGVIVAYGIRDKWDVNNIANTLTSKYIIKRY